MISAQKNVSLDFTSLITSVPIRRSFEVLVEKAFPHPTSPPQVSTADDPTNVLLICKNETSFSFCNRHVIQVNTCSFNHTSGQLLLTLFFVAWGKPDAKSNPSFKSMYLYKICCRYFFATFSELLRLNFLHHLAN